MFSSILALAVPRGKHGQGPSIPRRKRQYPTTGTVDTEAGEWTLHAVSLACTHEAAVEADVPGGRCKSLVGHRSGMSDHYVKRKPAMVAPASEAVDHAYRGTG